MILADSGTDGFQMSRVALGTRFRFGVFASLWVANPARGGYGLAPKANLKVAEAHEDAEVARINREARLPLSAPSLVPQAIQAIKGNGGKRLWNYGIVELLGLGD